VRSGSDGILPQPFNKVHRLAHQSIRHAPRAEARASLQFDGGGMAAAIVDNLATLGGLEARGLTLQVHKARMLALFVTLHR
jgi:hypothetical protein